ncbi:response regulator transcription factor [Spirulina sp. 06S082]|uniref:response regulator transcription factor n=1 Tax=Spirulina sp. 06S082 TaxID=3110248 RepID=UPI002B21D6D5|nr:response regulator transcription factor [Spirulina sp. 06S082]MEA5471569.1 response regulator transcription factor [Spirulina sp. 06S082]
MNKIRVVLVESRDLSRVGLSALLGKTQDIEVVGEAANGRQALEVLAFTQPDIVLMAINLPDINGIEVIQKLKRLRSPEPENTTKAIVLTARGSEDSVLAAFAAGADSYCLNDTSLETLIQAIKLTHEGDSWIDPSIAQIVLKHVKQEREEPHKTVEITALDPKSPLIIDADAITDRELDVLELIVAGHSNAAIADRLYITVGTVKTHVRSILGKLGAEDRTQAAVRALRLGLVS